MDETEGELCSLIRARSAPRHMTHSLKNRPFAAGVEFPVVYIQQVRRALITPS